MHLGGFFCHDRGLNHMSERKEERGFTVIEILVVISIIGILTLVSMPSIQDSLETRSLENSARDILTTLETARFRGVDTKLNHRVRFAQDAGGRWQVILEKEDPPGTWTSIKGFATKTISSRFVVSINLPADLAVEFSPVGLIEAYDSTKNSIGLQSLSLKSKSQPDLRTVTVYGGGSVRYTKSSSEG